MELNKAIRKQKKSYKRFMLTMCFIFFAMPAILYVTNKFTLFFISYLLVIEALIIIAMAIKLSNESFNYEIYLDKLKIKDGLFRGNLNINCDKISLVHVEEREDGIDVVVLMTSKFRSKSIRPVDEEFFKRHAVVSHEYNKLKKLNLEVEYFYIIIKKGGFLKYKLLIDMYKNCVKARYTESSIDNIKEWMSDS